MTIEDYALSEALEEYRKALNGRPFEQFYEESTQEELAQIRFFRLFREMVAEVMCVKKALRDFSIAAS